MLSERSSGILLHITSLPSLYGIGDLGPSAYAFVDFLHGAGQRYWQILPLNPTSLIMHNSPYSSASAFAFNLLLISPQQLVQDGWLPKGAVRKAPRFDVQRVDYPAVTAYKSEVLSQAWALFRQPNERPAAYRTFVRQQKHWLDDFALFMVLKTKYPDRAWCDWPQPLRDRVPQAIAQCRSDYADEIEEQRFYQFLFWQQWQQLKKYCKKKQIGLIGDMPIYVTYDSVDVWANSELFQLDEHKQPQVVAGVPPDYFSKTGQLWGNPVYNWELMRERKFFWWISRLKHSMALCDWVRVDHFRGFVDFWEIPAGEKTAVNGHWVNAPAQEFFTTLQQAFPEMPIIAEDLGIITDQVRETIKQFGFPGMKILMFAFYEDKPDHPYLPHNFIENCVVYTGTHDNNTVRGWFEAELSEADRQRLNAYIGHTVTAEGAAWDLTALALRSAAHMALIPLQDVLGLGAEHRMNVPGVGAGNWTWRFTPDMVEGAVSEKLRRLSTEVGRNAGRKRVRAK